MISKLSIISFHIFEDVPWGRCDILTNDSISILEVDGVEEGCLCTPTSALCYTGHHSNRPYLIYANKVSRLYFSESHLHSTVVGFMSVFFIGWATIHY